MVNIAVVMPIPSPSMVTAAKTKLGRARRLRRACRRRNQLRPADVVDEPYRPGVLPGDGNGSAEDAISHLTTVGQEVYSSRVSRWDCQRPDPFRYGVALEMRVV